MSTSRPVERANSVFDIGHWAQTWLELGSFSRDRFRFLEEERAEYLGKLKTFTTDILEHKIAEDSYPVSFSYKVPLSWWQMLKQEKAPKWFLSRYPVKTISKLARRTVKITRKATYPMADVPVPKELGKVVIKDVVRPLNFYEEED